MDWLWGLPQALLQRRNVSNVRVGLANGTKRTPSQNWRNLLSELHVPHRQCLAGISNAFSVSFTNIWPSFPRFYSTLRYTRRHLPSAIPWISEDRLFSSVLPWVLRHLSFTSHNIHYITSITRDCHVNILPSTEQKNTIEFNQKR